MSVPWPTIITSAAGLGAMGALGYGAFWPQSRLLAPVIWRGPRELPGRVALTFDDGPHPEATPPILDTLDRLGAKATFFVIGANAKRHPALLRRIDAAGHLIGNHSYDHAYLGMCRFGHYWANQIERTEQAVADAIGKRPQLFRPPLGFKQLFIARAALQRGYAIVTWTRRGRDGWPVSAEQILHRLCHATIGGDILTLHDGTDGRARRDPRPTVEVIEPLVTQLRAAELELERLDKLIGVRAYA